MAAGREIRNKIQSIKNTQKITKAMEMVAASKMRKAQDRMARSKPYSERIYDVITHIAKSHAEYHHIFLEQREVKRVGYIIVGSDRGLCGGLNTSLFKTAIQELKQWQEQDVAIDLCILGRKAEVFFKRHGGNVLGSATHLGDSPKISDVVGIVKVMLEAFEKQKVDAVYVVYNQFVNTMVQKPHVQQLLPLPASEEETLQHYWDYIYEPDARELLESLLSRYIEVEVYQAVIENFACEQSARMVAMKSASDNASDLIEEFQLAYNKARQAAITQEISEIVAGAAAV